MSLLSDYHLWDALRDGSLKVSPMPRDANIQAASIDLRLGRQFQLYQALGGLIDPMKPPEPGDMYTTSPAEGQPFVLRPGQFALGHTQERVTLGNALAGQVDGKSSLGRLGLSIHCTAGFIDPGFDGEVTLEFFNAAPRPMALWPGMLVCQMALHRVTSTVMRPYGSDGLGSRYQHSEGVVASRFHQIPEALRLR
jgi:dCTP deaminase